MTTFCSEMEEKTALSTVEEEKKDYFGKFRILYRLFGLSVDVNESVAYKIFSFLVIFIGIFLYGFIRFLELFRQDKQTVLNVIMYPYGQMLAFAKAMVFMRYRIRLGQLLKKLEQKPFIPNPNRGGAMEEKLMNDCLRIIKIQTLTYMGLALFFISASALVTFTWKIKSSDYHDWLFPYGPVTLVDVTDSDIYNICWVYDNLGMLVVVVIFTGVDSTVGAVLAIVTFQFKILQNNLRRIVEISYRDMLKETGNVENPSDTGFVDASIVPWKYLKKSLTEAINYHLEIIGVAKEIEEMFNGLMLFVFLNSLALLCILVDETSPLSRGGAICLCGQLLGICFWGEQMMFESQEVGKAAFEANFIGADLRFQKSLTLIIRRSQNPVVITAGKFTTVCLSTFTWILRAQYSASTVLRRIKQ